MTIEASVVTSIDTVHAKLAELRKHVRDADGKLPTIDLARLVVDLERIDAKLAKHQARLDNGR